MSNSLQILVSFWVIVAFSAGLAITGFAGLLGAAASSRALLAAYFGALLLFVLGEIGLGIFVLVYRPTVRESVYEYVKESYLLSPQDVAAIQYRVRLPSSRSIPFSIIAAVSWANPTGTV